MLDTHAMHKGLTDAGFAEAQADAILKAITGGVATKHDVDLLRAEMNGRFAVVEGRLTAIDVKLEALSQRVTVLFGIAIVAVAVPALWRILTP
jgi:hypothetical protein